MEGTRDEAHDRVQLHIDLTCEQSATRLARSTLLLNSKAPEQMTAEYWRWPAQVDLASFINTLFRFFS